MLKAIIGGGSGYIGSFLTRILLEAGIEAKLISRRFIANSYIWEDIKSNRIDENFDIFINLAGSPLERNGTTNENKNIGSGISNLGAVGITLTKTNLHLTPGTGLVILLSACAASIRLLIIVLDDIEENYEASFGNYYKSRKTTNQLMLELLKKQKTPPKIWMSASSVDIYPPSDEIIYSEDKMPEQFDPKKYNLMRLMSALEDQMNIPENLLSATSCVKLRFGDVIGPSSAAFAYSRFTTLMRLVHSNRPPSQYVSWIHVDDAVSSIVFLIRLLYKEKFNGPINIVAPSSQATTVSDIENAFVTSHGDKIQLTLEIPILKKLLEAYNSFNDFNIFTKLYNEKCRNQIRTEPSILAKYNFQFKHPNLNLVNDLMFLHL